MLEMFYSSIVQFAQSVDGVDIVDNQQQGGMCCAYFFAITLPSSYPGFTREWSNVFSETGVM